MRRRSPAFALLLLGAAACSRDPIAPTQVAERAFDAPAWASGDPAARIGMARRLVSSHALEHRPSTELVAMLGAPRPGASPDELRWYLGRRRSASPLMFPYEEYLVIRTDAAGACLSARIDDRD